MNVKLILTVILSSLAIWFVAQNSAVVEIVFLIWRFSIPAALLIFLTLLGGFLLGWTLHSYLAYRKAVDEYNYLR